MSERIRIYTNGQLVEGTLVASSHGYVGVEITYPFAHFTHFDFSLDPEFNPSVKARDLLKELYLVLAEIDDSVDRFSGIYRMLLNEIELISRVEDVQLREQMGDEMYKWFFRNITGVKSESHRIARYCGGQILNLFKVYSESGRKIYMKD